MLWRAELYWVTLETEIHPFLSGESLEEHRLLVEPFLQFRPESLWVVISEESKRGPGFCGFRGFRSTIVLRTLSERSNTLLHSTLHWGWLGSSLASFESRREMMRVTATAYLQTTLADLNKAYVLYTQTDLSWNGIQENPAVIWHLYVLVDPFFSALFFALCIAAVCWLVSVLTRNYSQVDRIWSIMPCIYTWHFALHRYFYAQLLGMTEKPYVQKFDPRLVCMALLATLWGSRLTYNFHRKGGYSWGSEDYRWPGLRAMMPGWCFQILNVFFISLFQNILLLLLAAPAYIVWRSRAAAPFYNILDSLAIISFLFFLVVETLTDSQQWNYQVDKYLKRKAGERLTGEYAYGFIRSGLFRYSRHPNFWAEMSLWWSMYIFSIAATGVFFNWSMIGAVLLTLLFQGSTLFTEHLSEQKYPQYTEYKKVTSRFLPMASGKMKLVAQNVHGDGKAKSRGSGSGSPKKTA